MKKIQCIVAALCLSSAALFAQESVLNFSPSTSRIQFGIGIPGVSTGKCIVPPIAVSYEHGVWGYGKSVIGVGGEFEYGKIRETSTNTNNSTVVVNVFGHYHYNIAPKFDVGGRLGIGYGSYGSASVSVKTVSFVTGADATYHFSKNFGVFLNLGICSIPGSSFLRVGISLQF